MEDAVEQTPGGAVPILRDQYEVERLPVEQRRLLDPALPIPPGVQFFPEAHSWRSVLLNLGVAGVAWLIGLAGIAGAILGFADAGDRTASSTIGCFAGMALIGCGSGVVCLLNARNRYRAMRDRARGEVTRIGLFLSPDGLLQRGPFTYRYFPRERLRGVRLEGGAPMIVFRNDAGEEQALTLPQNLVGMGAERTVGVVEGWLYSTPDA
jgi:hypothetical protein